LAYFQVQPARTMNTTLVTIDLVIGRPRPPRGGDGLGGLGDFTEVRQLRLWEPRP
jgi:hypothetical protein